MWRKRNDPAGVGDALDEALRHERNQKRKLRRKEAKAKSQAGPKEMPARVAAPQAKVRPASEAAPKREAPANV